MGQGESPEEEASLGNCASSGSSSGIQEGRFHFPPKSISIAEIVANAGNMSVTQKAGPRNSNFCDIQELCTFPAHEDQVSEVSRGQARKTASKLAI